MDGISLAELTRRRVPQVVGVTLAAGWGLLEFTDWAVVRFGLAPSLVIVALATWAVVVPSAAWVAWKLGAHDRPDRFASGDPPPRSIAVLPFANGSGDEAAEYLCVGISDEILTALSRISELRVVARTSSFAYRDAADDVRTIGRRLGARCILEGSVLVAGDRLRVATRLVDVLDGYQLWSERYDRAMDDVFRIRDEIAEAVAGALEIVLEDAERRALARPQTGDLRAYEHYVRGREFLLQMRRRSFQYAREMFDRALELDPGYALAWAGVAESAALQAMFYPAAAVDLVEAERASRRALELDPSLAEAHSAHGAVLFMAGRIPEAERAFQKALEIDPQHADTLYLYARACFQDGRFDEAAERFERAQAIRGDHESAFFAAQSHEALGDGEGARDSYERAAVSAAEHMALNPDDPRAATMRAVALCRLGDADEGLRWAERALSIDSKDAGVRYNVACLYAQAGRADEAVAHLEEATREGFGNREWLERDPDLDPIREDPRFLALLRGRDGSPGDAVSAAPVLETRDLTHHYGRTVGVEGLGLTVERGEVFGFLGPNGAGKTTTIRLVLDLIRPDRGTAWLFGVPSSDPSVRARVGYLPGELELDGRMTGSATLAFLGALDGHPGTRTAERRVALCRRLGLSSRDLSRRVRSYSRGMKQKLALVSAFQHDPELLVLDEPTAGLDPLVRETVFELLAEARRSGRTVFHSSHVLSEVARTCDRVGILRQGRLAAVMRVDEMRRASARRMEIHFADEVSRRELDLPGVEPLEIDGTRVVLRVTGDPGALIRLLATRDVRHFAFPEPGLEEAFASWYSDPPEGRGP